VFKRIIADLRKRQAFVSNPVLYMRDYLTMGAVDEGRELALMYPHAFAEWFEANGEQYYEDEDQFENAVNELADAEGDMYSVEIPDSVMEAFRESGIEAEVIQYADSPTFLHMDFEKLVKNQWLIHFTKDARALACGGFKYGIANFDRLGLTTHYTDKAKESGGYNFAYLIDDFERYGRSDRGGSWKYGDECVVFKAAGALVHHWGDEERQVIFWGKTARDIVALWEGDGGWQTDYDSRDKPCFASENLRDVVDWVAANFDQYKRYLTC